MISFNILDFFLFFVPGFLILIFKINFSDYGKRKTEIETVFWSIAYSAILMCLVHLSVLFIDKKYNNCLPVNLITDASKIFENSRYFIAVVLLYVIWGVAIAVYQLFILPIIIKLFQWLQKLFMVDVYDDGKEPWDYFFRDDRESGDKEGLIVTITKPSGDKTTGRVSCYSGTYDQDSAIVLHNADIFKWLEEKEILEKTLGEPTKSIFMLSNGHQIDLYDAKEVDKRIEQAKATATSSEAALS